MKLNFNPTVKADLKTRLQNLKDRTGIDLTPCELEYFSSIDFSKLSRKEVWERFGERAKIYLKAKSLPDMVSSESILEIDAMKNWIQALNNLQKYLQTHKENDMEENGENTLRGEQPEMFKAVADFLEAGVIEHKKRGKIVLPTGIGKTVLFTELAEAMDLPTLVIAPTKDLLTQTQQKFSKFAPEMETGKVFAGEKSFDAKVVITTRASFNQHIESGKFDPTKYKLVIVDEAHTMLTEKSKESILTMQNAGAVVLEFTATDEYSQDKKVDSFEIYKMEVKEAIKKGFLCGVSCVLAKVQADMSKFLIKTVDGYEVEALEQGLKKYAVYKASAKMYIENFSDKKAIIAVNSIKGINEQVAELKGKKKKDGSEIVAVGIHSELSDDRRKKIIADCLAGKVDVLVGDGLVITGLDLPNFSVLLNLKAMSSAVECAQLGGRILRIDDENLGKHAVNVQFIYNNPEEEEKRKKRNVVMYPEILGGTYVVPEKKKDKEKTVEEDDENEAGEIEDVCGPAGGQNEDLNPVSINGIEGLEVLVESEDVMSVVFNLAEDKRLPPKDWLSVNIFSVKIKRGVKNILSRFETL
jgi:superfamily II DNA or RNA helicase